MGLNGDNGDSGSSCIDSDKLPAVSSMLTGDDLSSHQRQIMGILLREGPQNVSRMANGIGRGRRSVIGDVRKLEEFRLVAFHHASGMAALTEAGRSFEFNSQSDMIFRRTGCHEAGMQEQQLSRAERRTRRQEERDAERRRRLMNGGHGIKEDVVVTNPELPQLPSDFVESGIGQLQILLQAGNFDAMQEAVEELRSRWRALQVVTSSSLASRPLGVRLATHLSECFAPDGTRIGVRIVNAVEAVCPATLGSIVEYWPHALMSYRQFGPTTVETIGQVLVGAGLLTADKFIDGMREVESECKSSVLK